MVSVMDIEENFKWAYKEEFLLLNVDGSGIHSSMWISMDLKWNRDLFWI